MKIPLPAGGPRCHRENTTSRVRLGGTWIGPVDDGKQLGVKAADFECTTAGDSAHTWRLTKIGSEQGA